MKGIYQLSQRVVSILGKLLGASPLKKLSVCREEGEIGPLEEREPLD